MSPTDVWSPDRLQAARHEADPLADSVVEQVYRDGERAAVDDLLAKLIRNDQALPEPLPAAVRAYLEDTRSLPDWADLDKIARGEDVFRSHGPLCLAALISCSLPEGYALRNIALVLDSTQELEAHATRRLLETAQMLVDVMSPGGLGPDGRGVRTIQRVRLLHASIRHLILSANADDRAGSDFGAVLSRMAWPVDERGVPICQEDMALTILAFSYVVVRSLLVLGQDLSNDDRDAYVYTWAVVGSMMGVREDLLPRDFDDAKRLFDAIYDHQVGASAPGRALTRHTLDSFYDLLRTRALPSFLVTRGLPVVIARELVSERTAEVTGLTDLSALQRLISVPLIHVAALFLGIFDWASHHEKALGIFERAHNRHVVRHLTALPREYERGLFHMPAELHQHWRASR